MKQKRLFPKCFKSNLNAVTFHDLVTEKHPALKEDTDFVSLCRHYTSLLCAIHFLKNGGEVEKIKTRFQRFLLLHYYSDCSWDHILHNYKKSIQGLSKSIQEKMEPADAEECRNIQNILDQQIFDFFDPMLTLKN